MADDDIYGNKARYEGFCEDLELRALPEEQWLGKASRKHRYRILSPGNLRHFRRLEEIFRSKDLSYVHRLRQFQHLLVAAHVCERDFSECTREDMDRIVAFMHTRYNSAKSKHDFIVYIRGIWKLLFPELDERGRIDDTLVPYVVRHLSPKIDRSRLTLRNDRLTWKEFMSIVNFFSGDARLQAYIMLAVESLGRPQEILTRKIKHVEVHDCYAKVWLTEHGKEGPGLLQCIDSYPFVQKWLDEHPQKGDPEAWLFINLGNRFAKQLAPWNINKHLKKACYHLGIKKRITCYSLKRNGVTFRRLRGDSDLEIQHAARWTSTKQLNTYDLSGQEDAFKAELIKRGIVNPAEKERHLQPSTKMCTFCGEINGFTDRFCSTCKRPLDREEIKGRVRSIESMQRQLEEQGEMLKQFERLKEQLQPLLDGNAARTP